jgi:hypothetical protein
MSELDTSRMVEALFEVRHKLRADWGLERVGQQGIEKILLILSEGLVAIRMSHRPFQFAV